MNNDEAVRIRVATPADLDSLAEVAERSFRDAFAEFNTVDDMDQYVNSTFNRDTLYPELQDPAATFLVAEVGGQIVGYAKVNRCEAPPCVTTPRPVELARLYVLETWHGRGPSSALLQATIDRAIAEGFGSVWLGVWEHNSRAINFYRKWDFTPVGRQTFVLGSDIQEDLVLVRLL